MTTHPVDEEELLVHTWRVARLTQLGISRAVAEVEADHLDWHQVARLVQHGGPPRNHAPAARALTGSIPPDTAGQGRLTIAGFAMPGGSVQITGPGTCTSRIPPGRRT